ncbi:MAG: M14 family metallopeptidase [Acidobacteriota bacterium]
MKAFKSFPILLIFLFLVFNLYIYPEELKVSFSNYHGYDELTTALKAINEKNRNISKLIPIGKTLQNREIWALEVTNYKTGNPEKKPGILVVGNVEANHLIGSEISLFLINHLLSNYGKDENVKKLLEQNVFYFIPRANPDGAEFMFKKPLYEQKYNLKPWDDDKDGRVDEDPPEDLNGDGAITMMRIKDTEGEYIIDPEDKRVMKKADITKGEKGEYKLFLEGIDNDKDESFNEDWPGGININQNFPFEYKFFSEGAGIYQVSENESRALADFSISHPNIAIILTFSSNDNILFPPKPSAPARATDQFQLPSGIVLPPEVSIEQIRASLGRMPEKNVVKEDIPYFTYVSDIYKKITGIKPEFQPQKINGNFSEWGYFHYGALSICSRVWFPPEVKEERKMPSMEQRGTEMPAQFPAQVPPQFAQFMQRRERTEGQEKEGIDEKKILKWIDRDKIDGFVQWQKIKHPDFPDKEVEVGGIKPYITINPPEKLIEELGKKHSEFFVQLAGLLPKISISRTKIENLEKNLYKITVELTNNGYLPTGLTHPINARRVRPIKVELKLNGQKMIAGNQISFIKSIDGMNKTHKLTWIINGKKGSKFTVNVDSQKAGEISKEIVLN